MTRCKILVATGNRGKLREILEIVGEMPVEWATLADYPPMPEAVEDGATFEANAEKKALHYASLAGVWTLADDSGLVVDALGGAPGVHSARYSGSRNDSANNRRLIAELRGVPQSLRTARFVCHAVLAEPGRVLACAEGTVEGVIIDEARGVNGFGYDPHFLLPGLNRTSAELDAAEKNRVSHRGQAMRRLAEQLERLLAQSHI